MVTYKDLLKAHFSDCDVGRARRKFGEEHLTSRLTVDRSEVLEPKLRGPWRDDVDAGLARWQFGYRTLSSGNTMELLMHIHAVDRNDVPLLTEWEQVAFCGDCKGSSGACPGFAPRFDTIKPKVRTLYVIATSMDAVWAMQYMPLNSSKVGWMLRGLQFIDRITVRYHGRLLETLRQCGFILGAGGCKACTSKKNCTAVRGGKCQQPSKRIYSMEAVGVDCDALHAAFYGEYLSWYYRRTNAMLTYMTRYAGILSDASPDVIVDAVHRAVINDKSFVPFDMVPHIDMPTARLMEIPSGVHKGCHQFVYDIDVS